MAVKKPLWFLAAGALGAIPQLAAGQEYTQEEIDSGTALEEMSAKAFETAMARLPDSGEGCTKESVRVRKEWRTLPGEMRMKYTNAVLCLMESESSYPDVEGAKSAWDDFGVLHYYHTPTAHYTATFLLWHRYYIWTLEEQLRNKCGYDGDFPYWEWGLDCDAPHLSPMFDGSETSMGSDGEALPGTTIRGVGGGTGGGCLTKGPFVNSTVNLGPVGSADPLVYNPRCIKRDLNGNICSAYASLRNTTETILNGTDIEIFQAILQGDSRYPESMRVGFGGIHGGGHYTIGGDPGGDFYFSPLEPAFYQHHGQIDRLYFVWQNLDWENRQDIAGTATMYNRPPSDEVQLDDTIDLSPLSPAVSIRDLINTAGGTPYCFVYE